MLLQVTHMIYELIQRAQVRCFYYVVFFGMGKQLLFNYHRLKPNTTIYIDVSTTLTYNYDYNSN